MALVVLSVLEQRLDAVRAALNDGDVTLIAAQAGVHRATLHRWMARYLTEGVAGLTEKPRRPASSPSQVDPAVEVAVAEMRRAHPRWGARRIRLEMLRRPHPDVDVPAERTIVRILQRQGLAGHRPRKRPRSSYVRFQRPAPMQMWGMDIVGGVPLVDVSTGELSQAKLVTAVDDHSRYCVIAKVVTFATGRAICLALAEALARFGVPAEILTDNGKQFTDRFGKGGEVLFDKICRKNGITHRLTQPASPNVNGKVERFHGTLRPDFLDVTGPFTSIPAAQAAIDAWVADYNTNRPHQGLDETVPVTPAQRFATTTAGEKALLPLWLPPTLATVTDTVPALTIAPITSSDTPPPAHPTPTATNPSSPPHDSAAAAVVNVLASSTPWVSGPVEFDRVVPASGNLAVARRQFWLGPLRAGMVVRFWADVDLIHLSIAGARVKTVRSHLSVNDLAALAATGGAVAAGPSPLPPIEAGGSAIEVERAVARGGTVSLGGHVMLAAERLAGMRVGIRIEASTVAFFDLATRELLRTRPNPLTWDQVRRLRGSRPAGAPPRPSLEPVEVRRRASNTGVVTVCGQKVALGRVHAWRTVTIHVAEATLAIHLEDGEVRVVARTTTMPVRNIKADRPRTVSVS